MENKIIFKKMSSMDLRVFDFATRLNYIKGENLDKLAEFFISTAIFCLFYSVFIWSKQDKHSKNRVRKLSSFFIFFDLLELVSLVIVYFFPVLVLCFSSLCHLLYK